MHQRGLVLASIDRLGGDAYGAEIERDIARMVFEQRALAAEAGVETKARTLGRGRVYVILGGLRRERLVEDQWAEPLPQVGGRARRLHRLTTRGRQELRRLAAGLRTRVWSWGDARDTS